eukprot:scaffold7407_cov120-Skeletonema_dohrnii-CCMP3373.AAC.7
MEEAKADPVETKRIPLYEYRYLRLMTGSCIPDVLNSSVEVAVEVQKMVSWERTAQSEALNESRQETLPQRKRFELLYFELKIT